VDRSAATSGQIQADVDVRVAFLSPYQSIGSTFRWIRAIDVR
jgi:hypothetical protein